MNQISHHNVSYEYNNGHRMTDNCMSRIIRYDLANTTINIVKINHSLTYHFDKVRNKQITRGTRTSTHFLTKLILLRYLLECQVESKSQHVSQLKKLKTLIWAKKMSSSLLLVGFRHDLYVKKKATV